MEIFTQISTYVPLAVVMFVYAATYVCRRQYSEEVIENGAKTLKAPKWLLFVPLCLGMLCGFMHYFISMTPEELIALSIPRRLLMATELGLGYGGASVLIWEGQKKFFKGKIADDDN